MGAITRIGAAFLMCACGVANAAQPPSTLENVVILAKTSLSIAQNNRHSSGQLVVNNPGGVATLRRSFGALTDTEIVADIIAIRGGRHAGPTLFDVFTQSALDRFVIINGQGPTHFTPPVFSPFPSPPIVTPGTDHCATPGRRPGDCTVQTLDGPVTLEPGNYNNIRLGGGASIYFTGGIYNVNSIRGSGHALFYFNGPTTLNVAQGARFGQRVFFGPPSESTVSGRCIVMNVAGTRAVKFSGNSNVMATIIAPNLVMKLGASGIYTGQFIANVVNVGGNSLLQAPPLPEQPCSPP